MGNPDHVAERLKEAGADRKEQPVSCAPAPHHFEAIKVMRVMRLRDPAARGPDNAINYESLVLFCTKCGTKIEE